MITKSNKYDVGIINEGDTGIRVLKQIAEKLQSDNLTPMESLRLSKFINSMTKYEFITFNSVYISVRNKSDVLTIECNPTPGLVEYLYDIGVKEFVVSYPMNSLQVSEVLDTSKYTLSKAMYYSSDIYGDQVPSFKFVRRL